MYAVREIVNCRPGKVRDLVAKFKSLGSPMQRIGLKPFRILTDVSGEPFWTVVAEIEVDSLNAFFEMENTLMADPEARQALAGYHDLVQSGRREIYRVES
jgi:hypothetical protein